MDQCSKFDDIKEHGVAGKARGVFEDGVHKFEFLHAIACDARYGSVGGDRHIFVVRSTDLSG